MKLGCCARIDQAGAVHAAGFDFIECTVVSLRPEESDSVFREILHQHRESPVPTEAFNVFLPPDMKIAGESVDENRVERYLETALERMKEVGADTVVFGSGGARSIPDGCSRERGEDQILRFLERAADYAEPLGITVVIEPLNTKESNILNSVTEAAEAARKLNRRGIRVLADFYHMDEEGESLEHIVRHKEDVKHIHVADSGRLAPGTGRYPYRRFVDCLRRAEYEGRISIECKWNDFDEEAAEAARFLRRQLQLQK